MVDKKDNSVNLEGLRPPLSRRLILLDDACRRVLGYGAIITSAADGRHSYESAHYRGDAVDVRTWTSETSGAQVNWSDRLRLSDRFRAVLGPGYDVIPEPTHVHIQFKPRTLAELRAAMEDIDETDYV